MSVKKTAALLLLAAAITGCSKAVSSNPGDAPLFSLKDLQGNTVSLASFKGHPVLIDFWATWCGPCRMSIPMVEKLYENHKADGLVVLGMNIDDDPTNVYAFVKQFGMTYPVLFAGGTQVPEQFEVDGIPSFYLIDKKGKVADHYEGFSDDMMDIWESEFKRLNAAS